MVFKDSWQWVKENRSIVLPFGLVLLLIGLGWYDATHSNYLIVWDLPDEKTAEVIMQNKITIREWVTLIIALAGVYFLSNRAKYQNKQVEIADKQVDIADRQAQIQADQVKAQAEQDIDQKFNTSIALLGNVETSARTGAVHALYRLALENEKYCGQIAQILCSHIRSKTQESKYREENKVRPSHEIQTAVDLLFKNLSGQEGLYFRFKSELPRADLSHAYLVGVDFRGGYCVGGNFEKSNLNEGCFVGMHCESANFRLADCESANFTEAHCEGAYFLSAYCENADFRRAHCEGAEFRSAICRRADFRDAYCEGAAFRSAHCGGAYFAYAHCEGVNFVYARCEGANFRSAHCEGADFRRASCEGANFTATYCQGGDFMGASCQGAYADSRNTSQTLVSRIGKETELYDMIVSGEFAKDAIDNIERARRDAEKFLPGDWYPSMQELINENKGEPVLADKPEGIIEGVLEDSEVLRALIRRLEEIDIPF